jgi:hypothetical protein
MSSNCLSIEAELLIAEAWALAADELQSGAVSSLFALPQPAVATRQLKRRTIEQLRSVREAMAAQQFTQQAHRRAEDRIRDELHDERAKTITCCSTTTGTLDRDDSRTSIAAAGRRCRPAAVHK